MGISICRERWAGEKELSAWPIGGTFHRPDARLLFTNYKAYLRGTVFQLWDKKKRAALDLTDSYPDVAQQFRGTLGEIIDPVELERARLERTATVSATRFNSFLEQVHDAAGRIGELRRDLDFAAFLCRLRDAFKGPQRNLP